MICLAKEIKIRSVCYWNDTSNITSPAKKNPAFKQPKFLARYANETDFISMSLLSTTPSANSKRNN